MYHRLSPDHIFLEAAQRVEKGEVCEDNGLIHALERALRGEEDAPTEVMYALDIYLDRYQKEVLEAFMVARASDVEIKDILEIPEEVCDVYRRLFFDETVFRNRLDLISYVASYDGNDAGFGKALKTVAVKIGLEPLKASFKPGYFVNPMTAVQESMTQSYLLSKAAMDHPIDSPKAREARQWAAMMISNINATANAAGLSDGGNRNLLIKLELMNYDHAVATAADDALPDIPREDIVHRSEEDK